MMILRRLLPLLLTAACLFAAACSKSPSGASPANPTAPIKLGFLVKQPEEPWFQLEWKFADQAAKEFGFELIKIGTPDGDKVLSAIDNLAAGGAQGFVICTPDARLGPAIVAKADGGRPLPRHLRP
jgi:L-arabinose transport system substrate-binding protein